MSGAVAFVVGLCALSFVAGCVLTAVMLRREPVPEEEPRQWSEAVEPDVREREQPWPPEDYATRPIHRNPVLGIPVPGIPQVLPEQPRLSVVPDPEPERPVEPAAVRRIHLVRDLPEPARRIGSEPALVALAPVGPEIAAAPETPGPVVLRTVRATDPEDGGEATPVTAAPGTAAPGTEAGRPAEPAERAPDATTPAHPANGAPAHVAVDLPAWADPCPPGESRPDASGCRERHLRAFGAARRRSEPGHRNPGLQ
ncbi:hypothetical protein [Saccharothrix longispora]|uniref:hypothetical protein n=1 Tax=Saccharothrix longispora TaxID=33920 RepID=UPI0028FD8650|nr:hypothetical protein [Saccharothrix longispora]MBY8847917.1 hypothetical protein [Saccharothrix sp. MB29]MDU0290077.1 hypothetical protein [Saccharothrix longispora]